MLELLGAKLASERGFLAAIETQVAPQRFLFLVVFFTLFAAVAHAGVIEYPQVLVVGAVRCVEYDVTYKKCKNVYYSNSKKNQ